MDKYILLALRGNFVKSKEPIIKFNILDLVRAKKEAQGKLESINYDVNEDGEVSKEDISLICSALMKE